RHGRGHGSRCRTPALGAVVGGGGEGVTAAGTEARNRRRAFFAELRRCLVLVLTPETLHSHAPLVPAVDWATRDTSPPPQEGQPDDRLDEPSGSKVVAKTNGAPEGAASTSFSASLWKWHQVAITAAENSKAPHPRSAEA